jgi:hypothetical protein
VWRRGETWSYGIQFPAIGCPQGHLLPPIFYRFLWGLHVKEGKKCVVKDDTEGEER